MGENNNNKKEMANMSKTILEINNEKQKLLNEKKLLENNLEQARQKLMDEINYRYDDEKGNVSTLIKRKTVRNEDNMRKDD